MNKLTFRKRLTQQLNRLLFPCHPESDNHRSTSASISTINVNTTPTIIATSSSSSIATISSINSSSRTIQEEQTDQTDFFENDEHVIVHELNRLPSLKPPPRPTKRSRGKNTKQTRSFESVLSQSTLTTIRTSHFDNMSEYIFGDHMSNTTSLSGDDEEIDDEEVFRPQVALSVAILPSVVAAATAARSRRYQARVARATQT
ncbi:hypothetical protein INT45_000545 [Circinella minor]|uniref:Uncharacterized protein n=1 Tax=Circinella minor TaxID=1195481 RepID=A0A8H7SDT9_9FUNG|nr:hypothetical protein INT45_000545 [Circinella minor]